MNGKFFDNNKQQVSWVHLLSLQLKLYQGIVKPRFDELPSNKLQHNTSSATLTVSWIIHFFMAWQTIKPRKSKH